MLHATEPKGKRASAHSYVVHLTGATVQFSVDAPDPGTAQRLVAEACERIGEAWDEDHGPFPMYIDGGQVTEIEDLGPGEGGDV